MTDIANPARAVCNPLDLSYRFQDVRFTGVVEGVKISEPHRSVHREAADPSVVLYRDRYYLFPSVSAGFWHSADLVTWTYQASTKLPALDYAPDVREIDGALYFSASRKQNSPFFRSVDPLADDFEQVTPGSFPFWDPALFQDTDGSRYLYWGCDNRAPLYGVELDAAFAPVGEPASLIRADVPAHGWEQVGEDYVLLEPATDQERMARQFLSTDPYIEGAWMTKRDDTYYLQYAAPATELNTYADGYYTSDSPLGPFQYSPDSPFSSKPGGFITGAGHGSTFRDKHGNWWHAATMRISVNHPWERRVAIFPAGFDDDGVLFCNQNFADYPHIVPDGAHDPWSPPQWMLLSLNAVATASSSENGHGPELAVDEDVRTWWVGGRREPGESLRLDLGAHSTVHAIQLNLADHRVAETAPEESQGELQRHTWRGIFTQHQAAEYCIEVSADGSEWAVVTDTRGIESDRPHGFTILEEPRRVRYVRVTSGRMPFNAPFAISGLRVFGIGEGDRPAGVEAAAARVDRTTARIEWEQSAGAIGYNVRYGRHPEKLYHSWLLYGRTGLDLRSLNAGVDYWVAVDAFNEAGITTGATVPIPGT